MTTQDILTAKITNIYEAGSFLDGREMPAITAVASDKQEKLAASKRYETLRLVCTLPATVSEGVAADPQFDAARAENALSQVVGQWLEPRTAREWIDNSPSLAGLCGDVMAAYQSQN